MTIVFNKLQENHLGYAAIFACIGLGFLFLRNVEKKEIGTGYWVLSFFFNSLGFLFWSGLIPLLPVSYFLIGEIFHIAGFIFLVAGVYRFIGRTYKRWNFIALGLWLCFWIAALALLKTHQTTAAYALKALRALLVIAGGAMLLTRTRDERRFGRNIAGISLILWGVYLCGSAFITFNAHLYFGFLVGLHILAAFGIVALVMEKIIIRAETSEKRARQLEGILPICSYCKKIRDEKNEWQYLEQYIEDRSKAEFSHGICPDCFKKHRPDLH